MRKLLLILLYAILSLPISILALFINTSQTRTSYSFGGEILASIYLAIVIYIIAILISIGAGYLLRHSKEKSFKDTLLIIYGLCIITIFFSSHMLCVYEKKQLTEEERREQSKKNFGKNKEEVEDMIEDAVIYTPNKEITSKDKNAINNKLKIFFNKSFSQIKNDSLYQDSVYKFTQWYLPNFMGDESNMFIETIFQSIGVEEIFYSSDYKRLIVFISHDIKYFDTDKKIKREAQTLVFIGKKVNHGIDLYPVQLYIKPTCPSKKISYYETFLYLSDEKHFQYCPFLSNNFWNCDFLFKKIKINNQELYSFQLEKNYQTEKYSIIEPIFRIQLGK